MSFLKNRSNKMKKDILNKISQNPNKVGFSIIFKAQESSAYIYRFIGSTYVVANLNYLDWSLVKVLDDLSWEELKKIKDNIVFINSSESDNWIKNKKTSLPLSIKQNIRKIFIKDVPQEYWF